jgi:2'-5' RNA ligase
MHGLAAPFAPGRAKPQRIPHVTLARARSPLHGLDRQPVEPDPPTFEVQQVELVRSRLSPRGARYETVAALPLHWPA